MNVKQFREELLLQLSRLDDDAELAFLLDCDQSGYMLTIQNRDDGEDVYEIECETYE